MYFLSYKRVSYAFISYNTNPVYVFLVILFSKLNFSKYTNTKECHIVILSNTLELRHRSVIAPFNHRFDCLHRITSTLCGENQMWLVVNLKMARIAVNVFIQ